MWNGGQPSLVVSGGSSLVRECRDRGPWPGSQQANVGSTCQSPEPWRLSFQSPQALFRGLLDHPDQLQAHGPLQAWFGEVECVFIELWMEQLGGWDQRSVL